MGINSENFILTEPQYNKGIALDEYNGTFSIVTADQNDRGIWAQWCYAQLYQNGAKAPSEKAFPMKVTLGKSVDEAIRNLEAILNMLRGGQQNNQQPQNQNNNQNQQNQNQNNQNSQQDQQNNVMRPNRTEGGYTPNQPQDDIPF